MQHKMIEIWHNDGLTYEEYLAEWQTRLDQPMKGLDRAARRNVFYARYNWERMERVVAAYKPSESLQNAIQAIDSPQFWGVITEDWCLDSAYALPIVAEAAQINPNITLRILLRDHHLDVMDRYLTDGKRNIPKLILFDELWDELFVWGPRPAAAQAYRDARQAEGVSGRDLSAALVDWFEADGWRIIEDELIEGLKPLEKSQLL